MKKILIKILLLLSIIFLVDYSLGKLTTFVFNRTYSGENGGNINHLLRLKNDFIVLGTSRAKFQINPDSIKCLGFPGYNAGVNGVGSVIYNSILLDLLAKQHNLPKSLILQLDAQDFEVKNQHRELSALYPFYEHSQLLRSFINNLNYEERIKTKFITYRYNGKLMNIVFNFLKKNSNSINNGFSASDTKLDTKKLIEENEKIQSFVHSDMKLKALDFILQTCIENKINLFLTFTPTYRNKLYRPEENRRIVEIIKKKSGKIPVLDYSNINEIQEIKSAEFWKDATHMNQWGAAIFSKHLNLKISENLEKEGTPKKMK